MGNGLKKALAATKGKVYRQATVWVPKGPEGTRRLVVDVPEKPARVWTLIDREPPPGLTLTPQTVKSTLGAGEVTGFLPQHKVNAFLEDEIHDWKWQGGKLRYYSRVADGDVYLLLEYGV